MANNCVVQFYEPLANWAIEVSHADSSNNNNQVEETKIAADNNDKETESTTEEKEKEKRGLLEDEWNPEAYMVPVELKNMDGSCAGPARIEFLPPLEVTLEQFVLTTKGTIADEDSISEESDENSDDEHEGNLKSKKVTYQTTETKTVKFNYV